MTICVKNWLMASVAPSGSIEYPYSLSEEDALQMSWESFAETVKHKVRYLMFPIEQHDEFHFREGLELSEVLDGFWVTRFFDMTFFRC